MIVYLARDIPAFVMYYVNGESGSSLLIESSDSMIGLGLHNSIVNIIFLLGASSIAMYSYYL